jgi:sterol O-acyltransferase
MITSPKKVLSFHDSDLTDALASRSGKFITATYINIFIFFLFYHIVYYFLDNGVSWEEDKIFLLNSFQSLHVCILLWLSYHLLILLTVYPLTKWWFNNQIKTPVIPIALLCLTNSTILTVTNTRRLTDHYGPASRIFLAIESLRLVMKSTAFVFETVSEKHKQRRNSDTPVTVTATASSDDHISLEVTCSPEHETNDQDWTSLRHFVYFLFAPTLLYRPSYPLKSERNWSLVFRYSFLILSLFCITFKFGEKTAIPLRVLGVERITWSTLLTQLYWTMWMSFISVICNIAHQELWSNVFGELTLFGDRRFYGDWYRQEESTKWLLKWNIIVQEFLFEYIYLFPRRRYGKFWGVFFVMLFSGIGHDFVIIVLVGMYLPIYTISLPAMAFMHLGKENRPLTVREQNATEGNQGEQKQETPSLSKFLVVSNQFVSQCIVYFPLYLEYYSRQNCPSQFSRVADFFIPRFPFCMSVGSE